MNSAIFYLAIAALVIGVMYWFGGKRIGVYGIVIASSVFIGTIVGRFTDQRATVVFIIFILVVLIKIPVISRILYK
jgi:hypothetical protein